MRQAASIRSPLLPNSYHVPTIFAARRRKLPRERTIHTRSFCSLQSHHSGTDLLPERHPGVTLDVEHLLARGQALLWEGHSSQLTVVPNAKNTVERPLVGLYRWRVIGLELLGTAAIMVVYFLLRGIRPDDVDGAVARSLHLIRFEQQVGLFQEVRWQSAFLGHGWAMSAANWIYAWGHYPVMLAIGVWLVIKDPIRFRFVRNVMLVSATIGIVSYWLVPAAPPRLMEAYGYDFGFIDTVHGASSEVNYFQPGPFVNDYAALPSFHFGWILLSSMAVWTNTTRKSIRGLAILMSVLMWWAVTVTGNHYFFDMAMGGAVVVLSWMFVGAMGDVHLRALPGAASTRTRELISRLPLRGR